MFRLSSPGNDPAGSYWERFVDAPTLDCRGGDESLQWRALYCGQHRLFCAPYLRRTSKNIDMIHSIRYLLVFLCLLALAGGIHTTSAAEGSGSAELPIEELRLFAEIFSKIKTDYVEEIDDATLLQDAVRGMLNGLDPHSGYLDPESLREINIDTRGEFGGLGLEVTLDDGVIRVVTPLDGTPAHKAGLRSGDLIIQLDDVVVKGLSLDEAVDRMRGRPGTQIVLTIMREGATQPFEVTLKRAIIQLQSVRTEVLEEGFGYARISQFQSGTAVSLRRKLEHLAETAGGSLAGLILDLRNNPGGVLDAAVEVSDLFLREGVIVFTQGRAADAGLTFDATPHDALDGAPLVVLVNGGSASASEIVAGALQDHGRALILGQQTFGKGSVQTILPMNNGAALKLTTARYYTPSKRSIQATGITPDIISRQLEPKAPNVDDRAEMRESSLAGHLENENGGNAIDEADVETVRLQDRDFEVGEALNVLKGMAIVRRQSS